MGSEDVEEITTQDSFTVNRYHCWTNALLVHRINCAKQRNSHFNEQFNNHIKLLACNDRMVEMSFGAHHRGDKCSLIETRSRAESEFKRRRSTIATSFMDQS